VAVPIVFCSLELHLPHCHSLKEKRSVLRKTAGRLRSRFNFSVAEIDYQDTWQRGRLGAVSIGSDRRLLQQVSQKLVAESERILGGDLIRYEIEIIEHE
jgi:uncharacterized protein YlxP (DUF503 family)